YNTYTEEVKAAVPPEKLLVFTVTEGWGPLCRFLSVAEPQEPFPNLNDRESVKKVIRDVIKGSYIMLGLSITGVMAVLGGVLWWLG
ncbi:MAG: hypothetical protein E5X59_40030, partial [Mesorhizobium sp.]